jgi:hypothetical protein
MIAKLLLGASLGLAPVVSLAQSTPHVYAGASALLFSSRPFRSYNQNTLGPALTIGYQLSPRWAIQSGIGWGWSNNSFTNDLRDAFSIYNRVTFDSHSDQLIIPLLARYTFTEQAGPLHIDALFGANWLHTIGRTEITYSGPIRTDVETYKGNGNVLNASVGPSIRYTLGAHLDILANSVVQVALANGYYAFSDRLSLNTQVGVQYNFGQ